MGKRHRAQSPYALAKFVAKMVGDVLQLHEKGNIQRKGRSTWKAPTSDYLNVNTNTDGAFDSNSDKGGYVMSSLTLVMLQATATWYERMAIWRMRYMRKHLLFVMEWPWQGVLEHRGSLWSQIVLLQFGSCPRRKVLDPRLQVYISGMMLGSLAGVSFLLLYVFRHVNREANAAAHC